MTKKCCEKTAEKMASVKNSPLKCDCGHLVTGKFAKAVFGKGVEAAVDLEPDEKLLTGWTCTGNCHVHQ